MAIFIFIKPVQIRFDLVELDSIPFHSIKFGSIKIKFRYTPAGPSNPILGLSGPWGLGLCHCRSVSAFFNLFSHFLFSQNTATSIDYFRIGGDFLP